MRYYPQILGYFKPTPQGQGFSACLQLLLQALYKVWSKQLDDLPDCDG